MEVIFHYTFKKQYKKLPAKTRARFNERLSLWRADSTDSRLRVHSLAGKYTGYFSMNVTGDIRALYQYEGDTVVVFGFIGTHSELYG